MNKDEAMKQALEALENNKRMHHYCEDTWYSCPKHKDGCANEAEGDECNCGADETNAEINEAITALRQAIEQAHVATNDTSQERVDKTAKQRHEPVVWMYQDKSSHAIKFQKHMSDFVDHSRFYETPLYTSPPQRKWVGLTADEIWKCNKAQIGSAVEVHICSAHQNVLDFAEAIEAKLREKNGC